LPVAQVIVRRVAGGGRSGLRPAGRPEPAEPARATDTVGVAPRAVRWRRAVTPPFSRATSLEASFGRWQVLFGAWTLDVPRGEMLASLGDQRGGQCRQLLRYGRRRGLPPPAVPFPLPNGRGHHGGPGRKTGARRYGDRESNGGRGHVFPGDSACEKTSSVSGWLHRPRTTPSQPGGRAQALELLRLLGERAVETAQGPCHG